MIPDAPRAAAGRRSALRAAAAWIALGVASALGGCAALKPSPDAGALGALRALTPAAAAPALLEVEIVAPADLRSLLQAHLDVVRLKQLAQGQEVSEAELTRLMQAAPAQVRELLQTEGYFRAQVRLQRSAPASAGAAVRVRLEVDPGPRAVVTQASIEFEGPLSVAAAAGEREALRTVSELRAAWPLREGASFRNAVWSESKSQLLARLRAAGYAAASLSGTAAEVDPQGRTVRLFVVADAGPLFRSGAIEIEGLRLHERQTVIHLADFGPGTVLTESLLLDFQDRLQKSGLFDRASVTLDADPQFASAARVRVALEEARAQQLVLGLGYSANSGQRATVEHIHRHVLGYAATARNKAEWGRARQAWEGELSSHPQAGLRRWIMGGSLERLEGPSDVVLTQRVRFGRARDTPALERLSFAEADRSVRRTPSGRTDSVAYSLNQQGTIRRLDSPLLPTDGYVLSLQAGAGHASDSSGAQGPFGRLWGRFTVYRPLGQNWYAQARLEAGQVITPEGLEVPEALRFRAGGDDSVRGYAYRSLGPLVGTAVGGGKALLSSSVELARPLSEKLASFWGAVFVDAGNAADSFGSLRPALGYGAGIRWRSPVGPLRLDLAYGRELAALRLHFSVGIAF